MKKYWPIMVLIVLMLSMYIYSRPIVFEEIINTSPDYIDLTITTWYGSTRISKNGEIEKDDFDKIIKPLKTRRYGKNIGNKYFSGDSGNYVRFFCGNLKEKKEQVITIFKSGSIDIDGQMYNCADNEDDYLELIDSLQEYVRDVMDES